MPWFLKKMGIFGIKKSGNYYHPGCHTYFKLKNIYELYLKIFDRLGISYNLMDEKVCCGLPALELGYETDARKLARKNFEAMKEKGVRRIMTNCPACQKMFAVDYKEMMPDWDIETENIWKIISSKLKEKPKLIKQLINEEVGFHDSSYLGRHLRIYEEPREILRLIGCSVKEISESREDSYEVSAGFLDIHNKSLSDKIAENRLLQFKRDRIKLVVTTSPADYIILKRNSYKHDIQVMDIAEILGTALGIYKKAVEENPEIEDNILVKELNKAMREDE